MGQPPVFNYISRAATGDVLPRLLSAAILGSSDAPMFKHRSVNGPCPGWNIFSYRFAGDCSRPVSLTAPAERFFLFRMTPLARPPTALLDARLSRNTRAVCYVGQNDSHMRGVASGPAAYPRDPQYGSPDPVIRRKTHQRTV